MKNNNISIMPIVTYANAYKDKYIIYEENKNKCGIYRWNNIVSGKSYIGSSINLRGRFGTYYSLSYLKKRTNKESSIIYNSLLKYGYYNFSLDILEYCQPNIVISREQYYLDLLKPKYNISRKAGSRLGTKQSEETKQLISNALKNRIFSEESKEKMRVAAKSRTGIKTSFFGKTHTIKTKNMIAVKKFLPIKVTNIETNNVLIFKNNSEAAKHLKVGESTLRRYKKKGKILLKKYVIINV